MPLVLGRREYVKLPLIQWWGAHVVEAVKTLRLTEMVTLVCATLSALGMIFGIFLWISGAFSGVTIVASEVSALKTLVAGLSTQMSRFQDQLNNGPRADQLLVIDRHLSAQDGRMDGLDTRMRDMEQRLSRAQAQIDATDAASGARLNRR